MRVARMLAALLLGGMSGAVTGTMALAECPQSLAPGVRLAFDDDSTALLRPAGAPGEVLEQLRFDGGDDGYDLRSYHGLFDIESIEFESGRVIAEYSEKSQYPGGPPAAPVEGMARVVVPVLVIATDERFERQIIVTSGALAPTDLAGCSYMALPVTLEWVDPAESSVSYHLYLPQLGTAILVGYEDAEGRDDYAVLGISVAPD